MELYKLIIMVTTIIEIVGIAAFLLECFVLQYAKLSKETREYLMENCCTFAVGILLLTFSNFYLSHAWYEVQMMLMR